MTTYKNGNSFREFLGESSESSNIPDWDADEVVDFVRTEWANISNGGLTTFSKGSLGGDSFLVGKFFLASNKNEAENNIMMNDALNLMITISADGIITIENSSYSVNPTNPFYAYSSHKVKLRKSRFKDTKKLKMTITKMFNTVIDEGKKLLKNGDFSVYDGKVTMDTIKKHLK